MLKRKIREENAEIMLESTIIMCITLMTLFIMMGLGFFICQQAITYTIATETASNIANTYKYTSVSDIEQRVISKAQATGLKMYRTTFALSSIRGSKQPLADEYVDGRVKVITFDPNDATVDIELKTDNIGRSHVEATVSIDAHPLFMGLLDDFSFIDDNFRFKATASAECMDIMGYASQVEFVNYIKKKCESSDGYNNIQGIVNDVVDIINELK